MTPKLNRIFFSRSSIERKPSTKEVKARSSTCFINARHKVVFPTPASPVNSTRRSRRAIALSISCVTRSYDRLGNAKRGSGDDPNAFSSKPKKDSYVSPSGDADAGLATGPDVSAEGRSV